MSYKERIFHAVLFELIALVIVIGLGSLFTTEDTGTVTWIVVTMSLTAMVWNYIYNWAVDHFIGTERARRGLRFRILHSLGFEGGLLLATVPFLMWALNLAFLPALLLDIGGVVFFLFYALVYNWSYDEIRQKMTSQKPVI